MLKKNKTHTDSINMYSARTFYSTLFGAIISSAVGTAFIVVRLSGTALITVFADAKRIDTIEQQLQGDFVRSAEYSNDKEHINTNLSEIKKSVERNNDLILELLKNSNK